MIVSTNGLNSLNALLVETIVNKEFEWENLYT